MKVISGGFAMSNQMSLIRDTEEVVKFLEFAGKKLILDSHAVNCRLTACHNLFAVVNDEEDNIDFLLTNLDLLVNRMRNKNKGVNESTLKVYKSRLKNTLEDYKGWAADPFAWEKRVTEKSKVQAAEARKLERVKKQAKTVKAPKTVKVSRREEAAEALAEATDAAESVPAPVVAPSIESTLTNFAAQGAGHIVSGQNSGKVRRLSLPIRNGFDIEVTLPADGITLKELQRIGLFLYPYCKDSDQTKAIFPGLPN
ncbi:MAG: hypothetical protein HYR96_12180 [Deltaproteobacteria bacterium]|nr:hypothetical protein [Deltaproteobacteria bacterium]MBI3294801.1 hypothetical protein [Deltaproteobacteria bacterium]